MNYKTEQLLVQQFAYMRRVGSYGNENYKLMADLKKWANKKQSFQ